MDTAPERQGRGSFGDDENLKLVIQRVLKAGVKVGGNAIAAIGKGMLVFIGIEKGDTPEAAGVLAEKILRLRIFADGQGKSNFSVRDIGGEILVVSQFPLAADLTRGTRPSFDPAEAPEKAVPIIRVFTQTLQNAGVVVREGQFGASMEVDMINDGPVTYILP
jgi:D-tyrosyl-tRNA(Tyr) deacylase